MPPSPPIPPNNQNNTQNGGNNNNINDNGINLNDIPLVAQTPVIDESSDDGDDNPAGQEYYDQYGQISYQQLNMDPNAQHTNLAESEDSDVDAFDDFQQLAESRISSRVNKQTALPNSTDEDENCAFKKIESEDIALDSTKINLINNIMSDIKLPPNCMPDWAKSVPEQLWKQNLVENLNAKQTSLFDVSKDIQKK